MVEEVERYTFTVNGKTVTTTENKSLLRFLRDDCYEYQTRKRQGHRDR